MIYVILLSCRRLVVYAERALTLSYHARTRVLVATMFVFVFVVRNVDWCVLARQLGTVVEYRGRAKHPGRLVRPGDASTLHVLIIAPCTPPHGRRGVDA